MLKNGQTYFKDLAVFAVSISVYLHIHIFTYQTQPAITCSKLTIETLEQSVKLLKVKNKDIRTTPLASFWCLYC